MADDFPPLPQGFTAVGDPAAPVPPATGAPPTAAPSSDFPALPQGFTAVDAGTIPPPAPKQYMNAKGEELSRITDPRDFGLELTNRIRGYEINSQDDAQDFADRYGPPGTRVNAEQTLKGRGLGQHVTNAADIDHSIEGWLANKKNNGVDIQPLLRLPTDDLRKMAEDEFNADVLAAMKEHGLSPDDGRVKRFISGMLRAPGQAIEGLEQLGIHAADAAGIIDHAKAKTGFDAIGYNSRVYDAAEERGRAGAAGNFVGDAVLSSAAPVAPVTRFGRLANFVATVGKRAGVGAAISAAQPSDTMEDQSKHIAIGAASMPFLVPIFEKVGSKLGQAGMSLWLKYLGEGQGKLLVDDAGNLTPYARMLKVRLSDTGTGVNPATAEEAIRGLAAHNPKELPDESNMVNEGLARRENVPLTSGEKTQDPHKMQIYERAKAGSIGGSEVQNEALAAERASSDALTRNVTDLGTGTDSKTAATNAGEAIHAKDAARASEAGDLFDQLENSQERITKPETLKTVRDKTLDDLGPSGQEIVSNTTKHFMGRLDDLANSGKSLVRTPADDAALEAQAGKVAELRNEVKGIADQNRKLAQGGGKPNTSQESSLRAQYESEASSLASMQAKLNGLPSEEEARLNFGKLWKLRRDLSAARREANFSDHGLNTLAHNFEDYISNATPDMFESGGNGTFKTLTEANTKYKDLMDDFSERKTNTRGSSAALGDTSGKAIANIVALVNQVGPKGTRAGQDISSDVERQIFGSGKGLSTQAANTIKQIAKVAPEALPHVRDVLVNRLSNEISESIAANAREVKPKTMQNVITGSMDNLRASGLFNESELQSLANNAYLASLKALPPGARNVGSGKFTNALVWSLRHSLTRVLGAALGAGEAAHLGSGGVTAIVAGAAGSEAAQGVGRAIEKGVARRAISGKVPVRQNAGGRVGGVVGAKMAVPATIGLDDLSGGAS